MRKIGFYCVLTLGVVLAATGCGSSKNVDPESSAQAPEKVSTEAKADENDAQKPKLVTIDDLDFLKPVTFADTDHGFRTMPEAGEAKASLAFVLPEGVDADDYKNFARFIGGMGWSVHLIEHGADLKVLEQEHNPETCTLVGAIGENAKDVLDFGYARRGSVDGAILVAFLRDDDVKYKKRLPIVLVGGGKDGVTPYDEITQQHPLYPAQTYFISINEANHTGFFEGKTFANDGEALVPPRQQKLILGELTSNMMERLCLTRETTLADEARRAAREAAKATREKEE